MFEILVVVISIAALLGYGSIIASFIIFGPPGGGRGGRKLPWWK